MKYNFVAMFHVVKDPEWFENILLFLKNQYKFIDANALIGSMKQREFRSSQCHLSFDDGHRSFYEVVLPILKKHSIPASLFLSPQIVKDNSAYWFQILRQLPQADLKTYLVSELKGHFDPNVLHAVSNGVILKSLKYNQISSLLESYCQLEGLEVTRGLNIDTAQIREIVESGLIEIGAHTLNHPILANEDDASAEMEIQDSIRITEELTQKPVRFFACPNGSYGRDFGEREIMIMQQHGIIMNFSTQPGHLGPQYGFFSVPRIGVSKGSRPFIYFKIQHPRLWSFVRDYRNPKSEMNQRNKLDAARL